MEQTVLRPKPMPGRSTAHPTEAERPADTEQSASTEQSAPPEAEGVPPQTEGAPAARRRPHAARRRGRRLVTALFSLLVAVVLVLAGIGLGTVGASVIGLSKLAEMKKQSASAGAAPPGSGGEPAGGAASTPASTAGNGDAADGRGGETAEPQTEPQGGQREAAGRAARATVGVEAVDAPGGSGAQVVGVHIPGPGHAAGLVRGDVLVALGGTRITCAADFAETVAEAHPGTPVELQVRHAGGERQTLTVTPGVVT